MMNRESYDFLYGRAPRRHNPGEYQNVDGRRAGAQQCPRAGVGGRARGEHVVDQQESSPRNLGFAMGRHAKGALDVVSALGLVEPDLLGRRRLSAPCATIRPLALAMISVSSADWL